MTNPKDTIKKCPKCKGTGWYQYTLRGRGTPHSKPCEFCCKHAGKPFSDKANGNPDRYYCAAGCGKEMAAPTSNPKDECGCWRYGNGDWHTNECLKSTRSTTVLNTTTQKDIHPDSMIEINPFSNAPHDESDKKCTDPRCKAISAILNEPTHHPHCPEYVPTTSVEEKKCEYCEAGEIHDPSAVYPCTPSSPKDNKPQSEWVKPYVGCDHEYPNKPQSESKDKYDKAICRPRQRCEAHKHLDVTAAPTDKNKWEEGFDLLFDKHFGQWEGPGDDDKEQIKLFITTLLANEKEKARDRDLIAYQKGKEVGRTESKEAIIDITDKHIEEEKRTFSFAKKIGRTETKEAILKLIEKIKNQPNDGDVPAMAIKEALTNLASKIREI